VVDVGSAAAGPPSIVQNAPTPVRQWLQDSRGERLGQRGRSVVALAAVRTAQRGGQFPLLGCRVGGGARGRDSRGGEQARHGNGDRRAAVRIARGSRRSRGHVGDLSLREQRPFLFVMTDGSQKQHEMELPAFRDDE
jgi:hypothetical protein